MMKGVPQRGFKDALADVRKRGRPITLDIADSAMAELGGAEEFARMIVGDLKRIRGDNLDEELKAFHDPDNKSLTKIYSMLIDLATGRDKLVGETADPLSEVSEEDLMVLAAQAAMLQIEVDQDFRRKILDALVVADPELVIEYAGKALDELDNRPRVEVLDAKPV
jgi:hypothetical protein